MRYEKSRRPLFAWVIAAAGALLLSACQTTNTTDAAGRGSQVSEWKVVDVAEVDTNLPLLLKQKVTKAEYQNRDNVINHYRMQLDWMKGKVFTQRVVRSWYSDATEKRLSDIEGFKTAVATLFKRDFVGHGEIVPIKHRTQKALGFATLVDVKNGARGDKCFYMKGGYRLQPRTVYDNDRGSIDTVIEMWYCDSGITMSDFTGAIETVSLVTDHSAFAAALAAK